MSDDIAFWLSYITNGKHLTWYASFQFTIFAAVVGGILAIVFGLIGATLKNSRFLPLRLLGSTYSNIVRGVPDVLFFLFVPLAFEQGVEWLLSTQVCSADTIAAQSAAWPPCKEANWILGTTEYLILASVSLGLVYGAFATNVIHGALRSVPKGQLEAARAYGLSAVQVLWRVQIRQMWVYALPGLSNVWMLIIKSTSLLSLLQIADIVLWADRLGAPNFLPAVGLVHEDWRWRYYLVLFVFYILVTFLSEKGFEAIMRRAGRGILSEAR
ncbi:MAG: ABC transporter permease subunit [Candidatus Devosia phytovorans]|uniref:ABC transporter permease subunit n=1 Tax=Candidatus Devosia phytovorans TaxID=3121372 RepID=A0AAJ5VUF9_9HYPH|nr:ABC transporter permease subunit [Devosia sp.]WEK05068.1 MAG: ABC transporter permease subunit [Devosia sp.]